VRSESGCTVEQAIETLRSVRERSTAHSTYQNAAVGGSSVQISAKYTHAEHIALVRHDRSNASSGLEIPYLKSAGMSMFTHHDLPVLKTSKEQTVSGGE
jgi:hypothetical protein